MSVNSKMTAIANAIRAKSGKTAPLNLDQMVTEIEGLNSGGDLFALIKATYPAGSICAATNGTKTLKAPDTSGLALFVIPEPKTLPETWTVTIIDPTNSAETKGQSVEITAKGQLAEVTLTWATYILKDGVFSPLVGGFTRVESDVKFTDGQIVGTTGNSNGNGFYLTNPIEINTNEDNTYNTLAIHVNLPSFRSGYPLVLGLHTVKMASGDYATQKNRFTAKATVAISSEYQTVLIDISGLSGTYYFNGCGIADFTIDEIWLE